MANLNSNTTGTILATAQLVPELWSKEVEKPFYKALQFAKLVSRDDSLVSSGGDIVRKPFLDTINARAKAASTAVTFDSPDGTPISYNIDKHYYSAVLIEDFAKVQASYDVAQNWRTAQGEAVARQIDTDLASLYGSAGTTVAGGAAVDDADVIAVVSALDNANVPQSERFGVIGQYTKGDLLGVNKYVAYDQTGKTGKAVDGSDGLVSSVYGMDIHMSQNVQVSTTGRNMFFHKKAISLAQQLKPTYKMEDSVDHIGMKAVLHAIYGVGVNRASALVQCTRTTAA
jgi:hypothetical protein